jgi:hypothetical protein
MSYTPADLDLLCQRLYGTLRWQSLFARDIGVSDRQVRRLMAGQSPVAASYIQAVITAAHRRREAAEAAAAAALAMLEKSQPQAPGDR